MLSLAANQSKSVDLFPQLRQTQQKPRLDDLFPRQLQSQYSLLVNLLWEGHEEQVVSCPMRSAVPHVEVHLASGSKCPPNDLGISCQHPGAEPTAAQQSKPHEIADHHA